MAGALINGKNRIDMLEQNLGLWRQKIGQLEKEQADLKRKLEPLVEKARMDEFNAILEEKINGVRHRLQAVEGQMKLGQQQITQNSPEVKEAKKWLAAYKKVIAPVFKISKVTTTHAGAYNFSVVYHHDCGKFQYICPLPKGHREALVRIAKELSQPQHCVRYSQVIPPLP